MATALYICFDILLLNWVGPGQWLSKVGLGLASFRVCRLGLRSTFGILFGMPGASRLLLMLVNGLVIVVVELVDLDGRLQLVGFSHTIQRAWYFVWWCMDVSVLGLTREDVVPCRFLFDDGDGHLFGVCSCILVLSKEGPYQALFLAEANAKVIVFDCSVTNDGFSVSWNVKVAVSYARPGADFHDVRFYWSFAKDRPLA